MEVDILAIGAHPDDVELSVAGTLLAERARGRSIGLLDLTRGELGTRGSADLRDREAAESAELIGASFRKNLKLVDGSIVNDEASRLAIIRVIRWSKPRIVLANARSDRHPDHGRAASLIADACFFSGLRRIETEYEGESQAAFRPQSLYHYIQDYYREPSFVVDISAHIERKMECVRCFGSQFNNAESEDPQTPLSGEDFFPFLYARARHFGRPAGFEFAEGFEKSRLFGVESLFGLV